MNGLEGRFGYEDSVDLKNSDVLIPRKGSDAYIQIFSFGRFVFEGRYSILEYLSEKISFRAGKRNLNIIGNRLRLKNVTNDGFSVIGNISAVSFE